MCIINISCYLPAGLVEHIQLMTWQLVWIDDGQAWRNDAKGGINMHRI